MGSTKLILSIIIPVYNTELYLEECVESILKQNLEDFEIIFVNDGSNDNSKNIMLQYENRYHFVKYYEQKNAGQGVARNVGLRHAQGTYIYFMDSDDYLVAGKLREMLNKAIKKDWDAIFFDGESFEHEHPDKNIERFDYKRKKEYGFYTSGELLLHDLSRNDELIIQPCLYLVKKEVYEKHSLVFPEKHIHEDEFFTVTLFLYVNKVYHTSEIVFMRRVREHSTVTNKNKTPSFLGYVNVLSYFEAVYKQHDFKIPEAKMAYRKKIKQLTKSAYVAYSQLEEKSTVQKEYQQLKKNTAKYNFFDFSTRLFIYITKYPTLLDNYQKIVKTIKSL